MTLVQVKKKAQVTLPKEVRDKLQVREGDLLEVTIEKEAIVLRPGPGDRVSARRLPASSLKQLSGVVSLGGNALNDSEELYDE